MRIYVLLVLVLLSLSSVTAQNSEVSKIGAPDESVIPILQLDSVDVDRAASNGLKVFKILPRGVIGYEVNAYDLRGGGAYYSFTKSSHSYNMVPQLSLERSNLQSGFYGPNFGFMLNVGKIDLSEINGRTPEVASLSSYVPRRYYSEVYDLEKRTREYTVDGKKYGPYLPAVAGDTYILRAISYGEADTLVAFKIDRINDDGSAIVFWKPLKDFAPTPLLRYTDSELSEKVAEILKSPAYEGVTFSVKENLLTLDGTMDLNNMNSLSQELNKAGISKISMKIGPKRTTPTTK